MKTLKKKLILKCLQCGEVFFNEVPTIPHTCKQLNSKLTDVLNLGTVEEIADATITGDCKIIGKIQYYSED